jgi:hypothetical protein
MSNPPYLFRTVLSILVIYFNMWAPSVVLGQDKPKESFYSQMTRVVVRLEEHQSVCTPGREWALEKNVPVGSAFFIHDRMLGEGERVVDRYFVVTARHVVEKRADLFARVQIASGNSEMAILVLPRPLWVFHPITASQDYLPIDIAVIQIPPTAFLKAFLHCDGENSQINCGVDKASKKIMLNQVGEPPSPMDRTIFFGFPSGEVASRAVDPFVRSGIVAYMAPNPELRIEGKKLADDSVFLIDSPAFPGNSGGPLIREPLTSSGAVNLLGLVTAGNMINKDYAVITSVKRIHETLVFAREKAALNRQAWVKEPPKMVLKCVESTEKRSY